MPSLPNFGDTRLASAPLYAGAARVTGFALRAGQGPKPHTDSDEAFLLVTEGSAQVTVGGTFHMLGPGDGLVLPAEVPHAVDAPTDARLVLIRSRA